MNKQKEKKQNIKKNKSKKNNTTTNIMPPDNSEMDNTSIPTIQKLIEDLKLTNNNLLEITQKDLKEEILLIFYLKQTKEM